MHKFLLGLLLWPIVFWDDRERIKPSFMAYFYFGLGIIVAVFFISALLHGKGNPLPLLMLFMYFGYLIREDIQKESGIKLF